jgi:oxygen-dependent protoporphyrinogen oxidase
MPTPHRALSRFEAMTDVKSIVIVGGGITGLSTAHAALARAREIGRAVRVIVLEGSTRFGGNLVTERSGGFLLDGGPDSWVATKPHASDLARALGLGGSLIGTIPANRRYYIAWNGRLHAVPEGLVLGVPTRLTALAWTPLFSWPGKLRMAMEPLVRVRDSAEGDESIAQFATRRLGREAADRLVAPLLGGISAGDASDLSVSASFPQLVAMEQDHGSLVRGMRAARRARERARGDGPEPSGFVSLAGGVGGLVGALVERLQAEGATLRLRTGVRALMRTGSGWSIAIDGGDPIAADAVLLAIPAYAAAPLAETLDPALAEKLGGLQSGTTATVFFGYRRADVEHPLDASGFLVPRAMGRPILAGTWVSSKWDGRAPDGHVLLRAFIGGPAATQELGGDDAGLVAVARRELGALMGVRAEPLFARVFRFDRASAQMRVGHAQTLREVRDRFAAVAPGVRIAGGGYDGIGIPDCIRQGQDHGRAMVDGL